jgi:hypothetical protein
MGTAQPNAVYKHMSAKRRGLPHYRTEYMADVSDAQCMKAFCVCKALFLLPRIVNNFIFPRK